MQQKSFEAEVLDALRTRVKTFSVRPTLGGSGRGFVLNTIRWRIEVIRDGAAMSVTDIQIILSPYLRAMTMNSKGGILLVTHDELPATLRDYLSSLTYTIEHCTLHSLYNKLLALGLEADKVATDGSEDEEVTLSEVQDDYPGRVITIDRSSSQYRELMKALDAVSDVVRTSNSLALRADVRERLLVEVRSGRALLDADTVRPEAVRAYWSGRSNGLPNRSGRSP